jgi:hypothetical protein
MQDALEDAYVTHAIESYIVDIVQALILGVITARPELFAVAFLVSLGPSLRRLAPPDYSLADEISADSGSPGR